VPDLDRALEWAARCPSAATGAEDPTKLATQSKAPWGLARISHQEPGATDYVYDSRYAADLVAIVNGQKICKRHLVAGHDAESGVRCALVDVETAPQGQHDTKQQQGKCN